MTKLKKILSSKPTCVGTGLVALDVILNGNPLTPAKLCTGGSCGNILSILSYFGWESKPIARLSKNEATKSLLKDLKKFRVSTELLSTTEDGSTPIIIHRILRDKKGNPKHKFEFRIPNSNLWLPSYKPVLSSSVEYITTKQINAQVFYFDRVSRASINLAKFYKGTGALIIFEPSSYKKDKQFAESLRISDIVKFSSERINNYSEMFPESIVPLEIETLGNGGLRYRLKSVNSTIWNRIMPFKLSNYVDAAGAGDWCTAGIINELGQNGIKSFNTASEKSIIKALILGQALGALNCTFDGARGIMYNMNYITLNDLVSKLIAIKDFSKISVKAEKKIITVKNFDFETLMK